MRWPSFLRSALVRRHVLVLVGILLLMGTVYSVTTLWLAQRAIESVQTRLQHDLAAVIARDHGFVLNGRLDMDAIRRAFHRYMVLNPSLELYLLDPNGKVELFNADPSRIKRRWVDPQPGLRGVNRKGEPWPLGDDPRSLEGKRPFSAAWLPDAAHGEKILYVVLSAGHHDQVNRYLQESVLLRMAFWGALAALLSGLVLGVLLFARLGRRLQSIEAQVEAFDLNKPSPTLTPVARPVDEVDTLHNALSRFMSALQQQWQRLRRMQADKDALINGLAHDLKTPLTTLRGFVELAHVQRRDAHLEAALKQVDRLERLITQLGFYARLQSGLMPFEPRPLALVPWLQHLLAAQRRIAPEVEWVLASACEPVCAVDETLLERALSNIFDNALAHGGARQVKVVLQCEASKIRLSICDDGRGVPNEALPKLFNEGYRVAAGRAGGHSGMGLSIVARIAARHGGAVAARPCEAGGLCIQLTLPCSEEAR